MWWTKSSMLKSPAIEIAMLFCWINWWPHRHWPRYCQLFKFNITYGDCWKCTIIAKWPVMSGSYVKSRILEYHISIIWSIASTRISTIFCPPKSYRRWLCPSLAWVLIYIDKLKLCEQHSKHVDCFFTDFPAREPKYGGYESAEDRTE